MELTAFIPRSVTGWKLLQSFSSTTQALTPVTWMLVKFTETYSLGLVILCAALTFFHEASLKPQGKSLPVYVPLEYHTPGYSVFDRADPSLALENWAIEAAHKLIDRYGQGKDAAPVSSKRNNYLHSRQVASIDLTNAFSDAIYVGSIAIGTPPQKFNMIMDTGSADIWVSDIGCGTEKGCPDSAKRFHPDVSTSYKNLEQSFKVQYGSGKARGHLASDSITLGELTVTGQSFGLCDQVDNILKPGLDISGIMGLAWRGIATSSSIPAWESLVLQNALQEPVISFALKRQIDKHSHKKDSDPAIKPGGVMTIGGTNASHYKGNIQYIPLSKDPTYWLITLRSLTVGDTQIDIGKPDAAIDTGTSLIGGPASDLERIFRAVPGSELMTSGSYKGYWAIPCHKKLCISVQFGNVSYPIEPADLDLGKFPERNLCITAFFTIENSSAKPNVPRWIFGAAFLKNVYVVFRAAPPSIGFAELSAHFTGRTTVAPTQIINSRLKAEFPGGRSQHLSRKNEARRISFYRLANLILILVAIHLPIVLMKPD
ncbi:hypothetical protein O181_025735 [Austropuccinia psidii MF-1]|uniref:Peptidase A1 domain-containing protein n=1 Tax=Austropuccinia psidii MF-1 TaxID=1389203 RepID=A0A9Q3CN20_9BASI|nr:hypothetical protein [Austropuccinia psidii MF-1]